MARRQAFSLVEVLVVIAILLILAAIVFVALNPSRVAAKRASCGTRLQQIYKAAAMYTADWEEAPSFEEIPGFTYIPNAYLGLEPYLRDKSVWHCPACPPELKERVANTYITMIVGEGSAEDGKTADGYRLPSYRKILSNIHAKHGSATPIAYCGIHDEFEVAPDDPTEGRAKMKPWIKWIGVDGAIRQGRVDWLEKRPYYSLILDMYNNR